MDTIQPAETYSVATSASFFQKEDKTEPLTVYDISGMICGKEYLTECLACHKKFTTKSSLKRHHERFPICVAWIEKNSSSLTRQSNEQIKPLHELVEKLLEESYYSTPFTCRYCKESFSNRGNLNRHFSSSVVCSRFALEHFHKAWFESVKK